MGRYSKPSVARGRHLAAAAAVFEKLGEGTEEELACVRVEEERSDIYAVNPPDNFWGSEDDKRKDGVDVGPKNLTRKGNKKRQVPVDEDGDTVAVDEEGAIAAVHRVYHGGADGGPLGSPGPAGGVAVQYSQFGPAGANVGGGDGREDGGLSSSGPMAAMVMPPSRSRQLGFRPPTGTDVDRGLLLSPGVNYADLPSPLPSPTANGGGANFFLHDDLLRGESRGKRSNEASGYGHSTASLLPSTTPDEGANRGRTSASRQSSRASPYRPSTAIRETITWGRRTLDAQRRRLEHDNLLPATSAVPASMGSVFGAVALQDKINEGNKVVPSSASVAATTATINSSGGASKAPPALHYRKQQLQKALEDAELRMNDLELKAYRDPTKSHATGSRRGASRGGSGSCVGGDNAGRLMPRSSQGSRQGSRHGSRAGSSRPGTRQRPPTVRTIERRVIQALDDVAVQTRALLSLSNPTMAMAMGLPSPLPSPKAVGNISGFGGAPPLPRSSSRQSMDGISQRRPKSNADAALDDVVGAALPPPPMIQQGRNSVVDKSRGSDISRTKTHHRPNLSVITGELPQPALAPVRSPPVGATSASSSSVTATAKVRVEASEIPPRPRGSPMSTASVLDSSGDEENAEDDVAFVASSSKVHASVPKSTGEKDNVPMASRQPWQQRARTVPSKKPERLGHDDEQGGSDEVDEEVLALLFEACAERDLLALESGLDGQKSSRYGPNAVNAEGSSLLHICAADGWVEGVHFCLSKGGDINCKPV